MDKPRYFNRQGDPIDMLNWATLMEDKSYRTIAQTHIHGLTNIFISTIWLGMDTGFGPSELMIFETMAFAESDWSGLSCRRYPTEEMARKGHMLEVELQLERLRAAKVVIEKVETVAVEEGL